jgi:ureidoglycolate dehydrogenase (NAD+)
MKTINADVARRICRHAALRRGVSDEHAAWFSDALVQTSLMGIDTHGLRLLPLYLRELEEGRSKPRPVMRVARAKGGTVVLDADSALGTVAGVHAARLAAELAREHGIAAVAVANSNHFGAASVYGLEIASHRMMGLVTTSAAARMAPFNGKLPRFGTDPICFAAPAGHGRSYLLDMATSQVSYSLIKHYRKNGQTLPGGWALDKFGEATENPEAVVSLSPLGGYKGQGLAMMVQILSCLLPAMPLDHELEQLDTGRFDEGRQIGHFLMAIDPARFTELDEFEARVLGLMDDVRSTPARVGAEVLVAGDLQAKAWAERLRTGIPISNEEATVLIREEAQMGDSVATPA